MLQSESLSSLRAITGYIRVRKPGRLTFITRKCQFFLQKHQLISKKRQEIYQKHELFTKNVTFLTNKYRDFDKYLLILTNNAANLVNTQYYVVKSEPLWIPYPYTVDQFMFWQIRAFCVVLRWHFIVKLAQCLCLTEAVFYSNMEQFGIRVYPYTVDQFIFWQIRAFRVVLRWHLIVKLAQCLCLTEAALAATRACLKCGTVP